MERVVSVPTEPRWFCERTNYLQELYERAGPPVGKDDGHGVGMRGPCVDEVLRQNSRYGSDRIVIDDPEYADYKLKKTFADNWTASEAK